MSIQFNKLTAKARRDLHPGQYLCEHGIKYLKLHNHDGLFYVYGTVNAKRFNRSVGRESEGVTLQFAIEVLEKLKTDLRTDRFDLPQGRKYEPCFEELVKRFFEQMKEIEAKNLDRKREHFDKYLIPFFKGKTLTDITTFDVERFKKSQLEAGLKPATVNRRLSTLSYFVNRCVDWGWVKHKPFQIKQLRENNFRNTYLTPEQIQLVLDAAKCDPYPIIYPFIVVGLHTSMRLREILAIRLKDIDVERCNIHIPKAKSGMRDQPITPELATFLKDYMRMVPKDQSWLFPSNKSKSGHYESIERPWRRVLEAAGLDPYLYVRHSLRHTAITHLVQAGVDLPTVMRISGHKSLSMVQRYSHQDGPHVQLAMQKLGRRLQVRQD